MNVVTLVPYRPANTPVGERYRWLWDVTLPALEALGYPVYVGEPYTDEWSRAEAVNAAAKAAGDWDVALIADCDTIPDRSSVERGVWWLGAAGIGAVRPHMCRIMLSDQGTLKFAQRGPAGLDDKRDYERFHQGGGLLLVTREAFDGVGGYDETFRGWGYEDTNFNLRVMRAYGWDRIPGNAWHLWHGREENRPRPESRARHAEMLKEYAREIRAWAFDKGVDRPEAVI